MKKTIRILSFALLFALLGTVSLSAQKTDYQIGEAEGGLLNDGKIKEAFQKAADKFEEWMYEGVPSGYVTGEEDYYLQKYADKNNRTAAIYVGPDYASYVLRGPIWEQLESLGGLKKVGRPVSDAYEVNGTWYQNFERGYATVNGDTGKAVFSEGVHVNDKGGTVPIATTDNSGASGTSGGASGSSDTSGKTTDDTSDTTMQSPSQMISDVVSDVEEGAPKWGVWVFVLFLVLAAGILLVYWFLKRK